MKIYCKNLKDLHMVFIDLEKVDDRVSHLVLWWMIEKNGIYIKYTDAVKDMYEGTISSM